MWWYDMVYIVWCVYCMMCILYDMYIDMILWYDILWYDMVYDMILYDMILYYDMYDMIWWYDMYDMYDMIWYDMICMIWYDDTFTLITKSNLMWWHYGLCLFHRNSWMDVHVDWMMKVSARRYTIASYILLHAIASCTCFIPLLSQLIWTQWWSEAWSKCKYHEASRMPDELMMTVTRSPWRWCNSQFWYSCHSCHSVNSVNSDNSDQFW